MTTFTDKLAKIDVDGVEDTGDKDNDAKRAGFVQAGAKQILKQSTDQPIKTVSFFVDHSDVSIPLDHDRIYSDLNESNCKELIDGIQAADKQLDAAIVRPNPDTQSTAKFELCTGARRHWVTKHLGLQFLVKVENLSDAEVFKVNDIENRARKDVTDYERGLRYIKAIEKGLYPDQPTLAKELGVSTMTVSRLIGVGQLPMEIADCFPSKADIKVRYVDKLRPLISRQKDLDEVIARARDIKQDQSEGVVLSGPDILARLVNECSKGVGTPGAPKNPFGEIALDDGTVFAKLSANEKRVTVTVNVGKGESKKMQKKLFNAIKRLKI